MAYYSQNYAGILGSALAWTTILINSSTCAEHHKPPFCSSIILAMVCREAFKFNILSLYKEINVFFVIVALHILY